MAIRKIALAAAGAVSLGSLAAPASATGEGTTVDATVYGWLAGATGEFTPFTGAPTLEFDNSFGEVLEDLDAAFFASAHLRKDRFVALVDVSYAALSREGLVPPGIPAEGKIKQFSITAAAGARVVESPTVAVDLVGGGTSTAPSRCPWREWRSRRTRRSSTPSSGQEWSPSSRRAFPC